MVASGPKLLQPDRHTVSKSNGTAEETACLDTLGSNENGGHENVACTVRELDSVLDCEVPSIVLTIQTRWSC